MQFAGVRALDAVDLTAERGDILGLIGPNGAGKTTLVNVLTGFQRPTSGEAYLDDLVLNGRAPHQFARIGVVRTFQSVRLFHRLTVLENVETYAVAARSLSRRAARAEALDLLELMGLADRAQMPATGLPHGIERKLGIARALAARPGFLLLDEPAAGLNEQESADLIGTLRTVAGERGCGVVLIEHDMQVIMELCARIHVLDFGKTICVGPPAQVREDPRVIEAYLGVEGGET